MTRIIAVASQKGGTAKTTTTINLGAELAASGKSVLLVELDPQGHLAEGLGINAGELEADISQVLDHRLQLTDILPQSTIVSGWPRLTSTLLISKTIWLRARGGSIDLGRRWSPSNISTT